MYISIAEAACLWHIPVTLLRRLCEQGRLRGAVRFGRVWALPEELPQGAVELHTGCDGDKSA